MAVKTGRSPPVAGGACCWHYGRLSECSATGSLAQVAATSSLSKYKIMTIESLIIINSGLKSAHREN